jgi:hypothetical protein
MHIADETPSTLDRGPGRQVLSTGHRALRCALTEAEQLAKAQDLANKLQEQAALKREHKAQIAAMKDEATDLQRQVDEVREDVRLRSEARSVEVEYIADFGRGVVECYRIDTGALVSSRALTNEERQLVLG